MMGSEIVNFITFQSPMVIVSRYLGLADAGAYSAANRFSSIPNQVVLSAAMGVLFPVFSHMSDDGERRSQRADAQHTGVDRLARADDVRASGRSRSRACC